MTTNFPAASLLMTFLAVPLSASAKNSLTEQGSRLTTTASIEKIWKSSYSEPEWLAFEDAKRQIYNDQSAVGDCAVVQLAAWCPDASFAEEVDDAISKRGKRMIPILRYALVHPIFIPCGEEGSCWSIYIDKVLDAVEKGERIGFGLDE